MARLTAAGSTLKAAGQTVNPTWNYTYADNGSLQTMTRNGQVFTYGYSSLSFEGGLPAVSNRLNKVTYTGSSPRPTGTNDNFNTMRTEASSRMLPRN